MTKIKEICYNFFFDSNNTTWFQIIVAFFFGVIFSPWSQSLAFFVLFLVAYTAVYIYVTGYVMPYWTLLNRVAIFMASILGFIVGRTVIGFHDPISNDKPTMIVKLKPAKPNPETRSASDFKIISVFP